MILTIASLSAFLVWLYLFYFHGNFWHGSFWHGSFWHGSFWHGSFWKAHLCHLEKVDPEQAEPEAWPSVTVLIPARDESETIWSVIMSHLLSEYPGECNFVLIDDHSSDGTAALARAAAGKDARLSILSPPPLPDGWTGKLWALNHGLQSLRDAPPDYVLFTDADIAHNSDTLKQLVTQAHANDLAMISLMSKLDARGFWGALLIPAFIYFFMKLYPFKRVNTPAFSLAGAAGGCSLINFNRLMETGGLPPIKGQLIDDCALAKQLKNTPPRQAIALYLADDEVRSLRDNRSLSSVWQMVTRTAFTQLDYSAWKLTGTILAMSLIYLCAPLILIGLPWHNQTGATVLAFLTLSLMLITYMPTLRLYKKPYIAAIGLPISGFLYTLMTLHSAIRHWRGRGGRWKGRHY